MAEPLVVLDPPPSRLPPAVGRWLDRLKASPLAARGLWPALAFAAALAAGVLWLALAPPERTPLFRNLPDADKAAVVGALEGAGFKVGLDARTGAVLLPAQDHARARMMLAGEGLPRSAPGALELIGDMPLGTSRAVEGARLRMAGERELARSIESLEGVESARVLIATPDPSPFVRDRPPPKASVTVTLARGRTLSAEETRAISHLVAGAVPGLSADAVAIADQTGRLLAGGPGSAGETALGRRLELQARLETRAEESIRALLAPIVGPGNLTAEVAVELDFATREAATERYQPDGALRSESVSSSTSSEPRAIGIPGALTNTVPAAPQMTAEAPPEATGPTAQTTQNQSATRNFELGRSVEVMANGGGAIRRMTAAVIVREDALGPPARRAETLRQLESLVGGAIGQDPARGDRVTVVARSFAPVEVAETPIWREPLVIEGAKWLAVALVALGLLFFVVRPLLSRWPKVPAAALDETAEAPAPRPEPRLIDYSAKLTEARLLASTDAARATAVARRLLAEQDV